MYRSVIPVFITYNKTFPNYDKLGEPKNYRCEDRKKVGDSRGDIGAIKKVLTPSFRKPQ